MLVRPNTGELTLMDWFCGAGGSSQGLHAVPGIDIKTAANHWDLALASHEANMPWVNHEKGDIREYARSQDYPIHTLLWASPECTNWTSAKGVVRVNDAQPMLFDTRTPDQKQADDEAARSRALMEEVPAYLASVQQRGGLVLAGVVENVVEARDSAKWPWWVGEFRRMGYRTRLIALNSMHVWGTATPAAPQSRDRLYFAYWHSSIGRDPDWNKWLRPQAWCGTCEAWVLAVQVFKDPRRDMGRYRSQYVYRCPSIACRNAIVEPAALPAMAAIDWSLPAKRIGDRSKPLAEATLRRIKAGIRRYWLEPDPAPGGSMLVPTGGTWRDSASPLTSPMPTRTTRENDGLAVPFLTPMRSNERTRTLDALRNPLCTIVADGANHGLVTGRGLLVPVEGRDGKAAAPITGPIRTQTTRNETGLALPFMVEMRGGSSDARQVTAPTATVTASGNHLFLASPPPLVMRNNNPRGDVGAMSTPAAEEFRTFTAEGRQSLLLPYYTTGTVRPVAEPMGTLSTVDRYGLLRACGDIDVANVRFRMLEPHEIADAMAFTRGYIVLGNKRQKVRQYGNAVTPPAAEVLGKALIEAITGEEIPREAAPMTADEIAEIARMDRSQHWN
jgi:DNA (cytosine-5)-methyltransferase 1